MKYSLIFFSLNLFLLIYSPLLSKKTTNDHVKRLEKEFIEKITQKVTEEILSSKKDDDQALKIVVEQSLKQRALLAASGEAVNILQKLQTELEKKCNIAKKSNDKKKEKTCKEELHEIKKSRNFLSKANKYVKKQTDKINKMFDEALKKNEMLMNQAQEVIKKLLEEK